MKRPTFGAVLEGLTESNPEWYISMEYQTSRRT
jgi:hypothetical protein